MFYNFILNNIYLFIVFLFLILIIFILEFIQIKFFNFILKPDDLVKLINCENIIILDFRNENSFKNCHIDKSVNISIRNNYMSFIKNNSKRKIVFIYKNNFLNEILLTKIRNQGFNNVYYLDNGINSWIEKNMPVKKYDK